MSVRLTVEVPDDRGGPPPPALSDAELGTMAGVRPLRVNELVWATYVLVS
jgi:hypothetical protein